MKVEVELKYYPPELRDMVSKLHEMDKQIHNIIVLSPEYIKVPCPIMKARNEIDLQIKTYMHNLALKLESTELTKEG
jgi:hypothetical protein